jgi:hypothetical protein
MPSTENGTVRISSDKRQARSRPALRVVGEPVAHHFGNGNSERRPRQYLIPAEVEILQVSARERAQNHRSIRGMRVKIEAASSRVGPSGFGGDDLLSA